MNELLYNQIKLEIKNNNVYSHNLYVNIRKVIVQLLNIAENDFLYHWFYKDKKKFMETLYNIPMIQLNRRELKLYSIISLLTIFDMEYIETI